MYVVSPPARLVLADDIMKPKAERIYTTITIYQIRESQTDILVASTSNPAIANHLCAMLNTSPFAEEIIAAIQNSVWHRAYGTMTAEVVEFSKRR